MNQNRRRFCLGALCALVSACAVGPTGTGQGEIVSWANFRRRFVDASGRLIDNGNGGISHSEGQGYAMLLAVRAADRTTFDTIWEWTRRHLADAKTALHAWRYDPRASPLVSDRNNATDGDILIAWALGDAGRRWEEAAYLEAAQALRRAILTRCTVRVADLQLLLPGAAGFVHEDFVTLNPSYYVWPALDAFHALAPAESWDRIRSDGETLLARARFGPDSLPTDWIDLTLAGDLRPAQGREPRFGFDAVRVALYAALTGRRELVRPIEQFWRRRAAQGGTIPAWIDVQSGVQAPYPASAGVLAIAALLTSLAKPARLSPDYYAAVLQMLADIPVAR